MSSQEQARRVASTLLVYVLERPELAAGFLGASGLEVQDLRRLSESGGLDLPLLDYILEDDERVLEAADSLDLRPEDFLRARTAMEGPGGYGWEIG
ncbi:DUF3572 family protein [Paracoccus sp. Z330]|uniref:DUF3572 family protein n=1 Tax=Paracoccus onchidii TaxID=3017813 RepID=A0ABT4ZE42_9RHOB|nr:DUF3572 family protein [Paracoccus onchidii]MDB6176955.1 DUF3572 family protein [Paracoccus onchidii]